MPFIAQERRDAIESGNELEGGLQPGDLCYIYYKDMVDAWKSNPRWKTAHELYRDFFEPTSMSQDDHVARSLAWQVFFNLHVMPYELKKREENGDI